MSSDVCRAENQKLHLCISYKLSIIKILVSGIVPITSLLRQHVGNMLTMDRDNFLVSLKENEKRSIRIRAATEHKQGSFFSRLLSSFRSRADDTLSKASRRERKIQSRYVGVVYQLHSATIDVSHMFVWLLAHSSFKDDGPEPNTSDQGADRGS